jgi:hypothetical protein
MARKKRKGPGGPGYFQLFHNLTDSHAWHLLPPLYRCGYIELARLYNGENNGRLAMSARRLAHQIPCNKDTAAEALRALEDAGFIETVKFGRFARKADQRVSSEYRLTCFRCDATGELPSRKFNPQIRWDIRDGNKRPESKQPPMTHAERQRRYRKKCRRKERDESDSDRPTKPDGIVRPNRTDPVTRDAICPTEPDVRVTKVTFERPTKPDTYISTIGGAASDGAPVTDAGEQERVAPLPEQSVRPRPNGVLAPLNAFLLGTTALTPLGGSDSDRTPTAIFNQKEA